MGLFPGLGSGREGLMTHGVAMATVADNVSNSNTTGFKSSRIEFADMLASGVGSLYGGRASAGDGNRVQDIALILEQGAIEDTGRELDAAIEGKGYFILNNGVDERNFYTRAGNFTVDKEGRIVNADGLFVMGYAPGEGEEAQKTLSQLSVQSATSGAEATTRVGIRGNLEATAPIGQPPANPTEFNEISAQAAFSVPLTVIDSLGTQRSVTMYFFRTANLTYQAQAYVDGSAVGGAAGTPVAIGQPATINFGTDGRIPEGTEVLMNLNPAWGDGAAAGAIEVDLAGMTGYSSPSYLSAVTADGKTVGNPTGVEMDQEGNIYVKMSNGETVLVGAFALANFTNPYGVERVGNSNFIETEESGEALIDTALTNGRGAIKGAALENSNVDLASQFVDVIKYQRGYQASSQVVQTLSQLASDTIQIA